ncbi:FimV/HubP family polar landmark protein [Paraburkholderia fungorum]|uniref:FimV/HubP family polar landmark protein n=1 Tax=Paraburkholderia fungorum TaxID=134537 RepID=UPI0038BE0F5B
MNLRLSPLRAMLTHEDTGRFAASAVLALALAGVGIGNASAAPDDAASAPDAAFVSYAAGGQYTVRPGQSLNDVAIAVTQSHDRATLVRASRALFDANPNAFMSHDPSRMRVGAVLTVPVLDATGALAASAAVAGSAPVAAPASASVSGANAAVASGVAQVNAAAASAASAAARAAEPATPAATGTASAAAEANPAAPSSAAVAGAGSSAPVAGSQAAASPASGAHVWAGSVQPSASEAAEAAAPGAQPASQARTQVSSLQQLLALKNRVLMELQKHGIGGSPAATSAVSSGAQPAAGVSSAAVVPAHGGTAVAPSNEGGLSQTNLSVAAAVGAALVVLLGALRLRRKKRAMALDEAASTENKATVPPEIVSTREPMPAREASAATDDAAAVQPAVALGSAEREAAARETAERVAAEREAEIRSAAEREAAEREAAARETAERVAAEREAEIRSAAAQEATERDVAEREAAEREAAEREAAERAAAEHKAAEQATAALPTQETSAPRDPWQDRPAAPAAFAPLQMNTDVAPAARSDFAPEPVAPAHHEDFSGATTAASLAAAAELGAEALPLTPLEPVSEAVQAEQQHHGLQWDDAPASNAPIAPPPVIDFTEPHLESHTTSRLGQPDSETPPHSAPVAHAQSTPAVPSEFPRDAVDAFGSLDMPLPPRIESADDPLDVLASLATQPVVSPETTAQQALAQHDPDDAPHIADEIAAGTAGHAAVAGLGAVGFGALKLDFDLELPPSPAQPLPAFTQIDLSRIARNKLDLAAEYIDLGDLSGARTLINEVIEVNDPGTRTEARALLSTLAPLS